MKEYVMRDEDTNYYLCRVELIKDETYDFLFNKNIERAMRFELNDACNLAVKMAKIYGYYMVVKKEEVA